MTLSCKPIGKQIAFAILIGVPAGASAQDLDGVPTWLTCVPGSCFQAESYFGAALSDASMARSEAASGCAVFGPSDPLCVAEDHYGDCAADTYLALQYIDTAQSRHSGAAFTAASIGFSAYQWCEAGYEISEYMCQVYGDLYSCNSEWYAFWALWELEGAIDLALQCTDDFTPACDLDT